MSKAQLGVVKWCNIVQVVYIPLYVGKIKLVKHLGPHNQENIQRASNCFSSEEEKTVDIMPFAAEK